MAAADNNNNDDNDDDTPTSESFLTRTVDVQDRRFLIRVLRFENGSFVSVTEGADRIGSMMVSLAAGPRPVTTTVIPAKTGSAFVKLVAEKVSSTVQGIAVVSVNVGAEIDVGSAKAIMSGVAEMVRNV